jgi:NitT/TauT family transport system ATP-binding protein
VFQNPVLLPWRTVIDNVRLPLEVTPAAKRKSIMSPDDLLTLVGLEEFADAYPRECSGGMQQRVSIARALTLDPSVLLMDEPFGALDEITRTQMNLELLKYIAADGPSVLFVTHSIDEAVFMSDRVVVMTSRPGRTKEIIDVDLPRPREPAMRGSVEFLHIENRIRDALGT